MQANFNLTSATYTNKTVTFYFVNLMSGNIILKLAIDNSGFK